MKILEDTLHKTDQPSPTFVLTGESALRKAVEEWTYKRDSGVKELSMDSYLASLAAADLNEALSLKPTRDSSALVHGYMMDSGKEPPHVRAPWYDTIGRSTFCRGLKGIAAEIEEKPAIAPESTPSPSGRAAQFNKKFGGVRGLSGLTKRQPLGNEGYEKSETQR